MRAVSHLTLVCATLAGWPSLAAAQDVPSRVEVGGHVDVIGLTSFPTPAAGVWSDINLSRPLALEVRATWLDEALVPAVHAAAGVRATFVRTARTSFYGLALPGWYRFSRDVLTEGRSHFVCDLVAGFAFAPARGLVARVEVERDLHALPAFSLVGVTRRGATIPVAIPGFVASRWNLTVGASYALGAPLAPAETRPAKGRWSAGSQLGYTVSTTSTRAGTVGFFASYGIAKYCDLDVSVSTYVTGDLPPAQYDGGRMTQALVGIKAGVREGRFGVFFKARAGVNSSARIYPTGPSTRFGRSTSPALDLGGVIEASLSRSTFLRADIGETLTFVSRDEAPPIGLEFLVNGPGELYTLPIRLGVGWRF